MAPKIAAAGPAASAAASKPAGGAASAAASKPAGGAASAAASKPAGPAASAASGAPRKPQNDVGINLTKDPTICSCVPLSVDSLRGHEPCEGYMDIGLEGYWAIGLSYRATGL